MRHAKLRGKHERHVHVFFLFSIFYFRLSSIVYYTRIHAHQFSAAPCRRMCRSTVSTTRITPTPPSTPPSAPSARRSVGPFERHSQLEVGDLPEKVCGWDSGGRRARASVGMMHLTTRPRDIGACADPQTHQSWARGRRHSTRARATDRFCDWQERLLSKVRTAQP